MKLSSNIPAVTVALISFVLQAAALPVADEPISTTAEIPTPVGDVPIADLAEQPTPVVNVVVASTVPTQGTRVCSTGTCRTETLADGEGERCINWSDYFGSDHAFVSAQSSAGRCIILKTGRGCTGDTSNPIVYPTPYYAENGYWSTHVASYKVYRTNGNC